MNTKTNGRKTQVEAHASKDASAPAAPKQVRPAKADLKWWQFFAAAHA